MNSQSQTQPLPQTDEELRDRDYVKATALIVGACASIAIGFTLIPILFKARAAKLT